MQVAGPTKDLQDRLGFPMNTQLLVAILSIVALHVAALAGGGLALGIMRLLGHGPASANEADARESIH
jgi:hypothetical protein